MVLSWARRSRSHRTLDRLPLRLDVDVVGRSVDDQGRCELESVPVVARLCAAAAAFVRIAADTHLLLHIGDAR